MQNFFQSSTPLWRTVSQCTISNYCTICVVCRIMHDQVSFRSLEMRDVFCYSNYPGTKDRSSLLHGNYIQTSQRQYWKHTDLHSAIMNEKWAPILATFSLIVLYIVVCGKHQCKLCTITHHIVKHPELLFLFVVDNKLRLRTGVLNGEKKYLYYVV